MYLFIESGVFRQMTTYIVLKDSPVWRKPNGSKPGRILEGRIIEVVEVVPGWVRFNSPSVTDEPEHQWLKEDVVSVYTDDSTPNTDPDPGPDPDPNPAIRYYFSQLNEVDGTVETIELVELSSGE